MVRCAIASAMAKFQTHPSLRCERLSWEKESNGQPACAVRRTHGRPVGKPRKKGKWRVGLRKSRRRWVPGRPARPTSRSTRRHQRSFKTLEPEQEVGTAAPFQPFQIRNPEEKNVLMFD